MIVAVPAERMRAREAGIRLGHLPTGQKNAITDVAGVRVGHTTLSRDPDDLGRAMRTGVTAVWPHAGLPWREPVYAGTMIGGSFTGSATVSDTRRTFTTWHTGCAR